MTQSRYGKKWNKEEEDILREHYPKGGAAVCVPLLSGRSHESIVIRARALGLWAPAYIQDANKFKPGRKTWNKGKHYMPGGDSAKTQWKGGRDHDKWRPVGSTRVNIGGYLARKVYDTGKYTDWIPEHQLVWTKHHGPIAEGSVVVFKNGNRSDIRIENLELITRKELLQRNSVNNLPEELKEVIRLKARLTRVIGELNEKQNG